MTKLRMAVAAMPDMSRNGRPDRPTALPAAHDRLVAGWRPGGGWHRVVHALDAAGRLDGDPDMYATYEHETLQRSALWWVSAEMCTLLDVAMQQLPRDTVLDDGVLLDEAGFCMFATPMQLTDAATGQRDLIVDAVSWGPLHVVDDTGCEGSGIGISSYTWHATPGCSPLGRSEWIVGQALDGFLPGQVLRGRSYCMAAVEDRSLLAAVALLSRQENIAEVSTVVPDRAERRRAARSGRDAAVRVVRLHPRHTAHGAGSGAMTVRTIVRGHWRNQPYGPGRAERRPVWIAPHLRGPDGAPLVVRPTVRVV